MIDNFSFYAGAACGLIVTIGISWVLSMCRVSANADRCANCGMVKYKAEAERLEWEREEQAMKASSQVILPTLTQPDRGLSEEAVEKLRTAGTISQGKLKGAILHFPPKD